ncbi:MAG: undecaprenyl-diphosphatase UppP [Actinomycetota bacterium]|nr:undecaprenyl-diphosphatase UppP [Actinomycetota bacterium]MCL6093906.1 undecaprenyl-diphosphatase UppP [Actinomycetota bacterium]MDA8167174.1 undecaprenyl-diphosphatase UppP [Actinomycetota bacterium]
MTLLQALVLGIVQGLTEFLPVSSSGHLVIVPDLLGWSEPSISFDIVLHLGTMVAVIAYFWRDLVAIVSAFFEPYSGPVRARRRLGSLIIIGTIPGAIAGAALEKKFAEVFDRPSEVAVFLLLTGVILVAAEAAARQQRGIGKLKVVDSLIIGVAQAVAILPGISRSGATISSGLFLGLKREAAARYSFLLSIPIIAGAALLKLRHGFDGSESLLALLTGFAAATVSGILAVRFLLGFVRRHSLRGFAYYCWIAGAIVIVYHAL